MNSQRNCDIAIETLISMFTVEDGEIKVLLMRKKTEPYKGYWILPGDFIKNDETLEDTIIDAVYDKLGIASMYLEQAGSYSAIDRNPESRVIAFSFFGLVDIVSIKLKRVENSEYETNWFSIDSIPKMGYDHDIILNKTIDILKNKLNDYSFLKYLFPSDFTLPEIQNVYEQLNRVKVDRRNFRKKILNSELIESTGDKNEGFMGRPANLYRFKSESNSVSTFS